MVVILSVQDVAHFLEAADQSEFDLEAKDISAKVMAKIAKRAMRNFIFCFLVF